MTTLREAAQQALEALVARGQRGDGAPDTVAALRAALAQEEQKEQPVGWLESPYGAFRANPLYRMTAPQALAWKIHLYTAPPRREQEEQAAVEIKPPSPEGATQCIVRWMVETPAGWVGAWDREALQQFVTPPRREQEQEPAVRVVKTGATLRMDLREGVLALPDGEHGLYTASPCREQGQEPVAWQHKEPIPNTRGETIGYSDWKHGKGLGWWPKRALYTNPPRSEWKGLSPEEIDTHWHGTDWRESVFVRLPAFARAIEQALKEKNHG